VSFFDEFQPLPKGSISLRILGEAGRQLNNPAQGDRSVPQVPIFGHEDILPPPIVRSGVKTRDH
jgi:hypothetical protein